MEMHRHTFRKAERLCSKKHIETLFAGGSRTISAYPLRVVFTTTSPSQAKERVSVLVSVSKRHLRHAVDRNSVKRLIREAYRLNKEVLLSALAEGQCLDIAFIWMSDERSEFHIVESKVKLLLQRMAELLME